MKKICLLTPILFSLLVPTQSSFKTNLQNTIPTAGPGVLGQRHVKVLEAEKKFNSSYKSFEFISEDEVGSIKVQGDVVLTDYQIINKEVIATLSYFKDQTEIKFLFYDLKETLIDMVSLYFALGDNNYFFSSNLSMDTAKRYAGQDVGYTFWTEDNGVNSSVNTYSAQAIGAEGRISGTIEWTDEQGVTHPLFGAKIAVTIAGSWWRGETYTNAQGFYNINYSGIWYIGSGKPTIHVVAENPNVNVKSLNGGVYEKAVEFDSNIDRSFNYTFSPIKDQDLGKAIMIFQGAKLFSSYLIDYMDGGEKTPSCSIFYPGKDKQTAYYLENSIHIPTKEKSSSSLPSYYASWDVLGHEYGHHIENTLGFTKSPGGSHALNENIINRQVKDGYPLHEAKDRGYKLAWAEGWATYWSTVTQNHFPDEYKGIKTVADTWYTAPNGAICNLDYYDTGFGDADEVVVQRILYKLTSLQEDEYDKFKIQEWELWKLIRNNKPVTFYEFINHLYKAGYNKGDLHLLISKFNVVAPNITLSYTNGFPTFSVSTYMGSKNVRFNEFKFYFGKNGEIGNLSTKPTGNIASVTLTYNQVRFLYFSGEEFIVYFLAKQTDNFASGNYYSRDFVFDHQILFE